MERDPILFAWRSAPALHVLAVALGIGLGVPIVFFALLCLRDFVGLFGTAGAPPPFLELTLPIPGEPPSRLPLVSGWALSIEDLTLAALAGLAASALMLAGLSWVVTGLCFSAQARAAARLRSAATEAILTAPAGAREDLRVLPELVGQSLAALPAAGVLLPALTLAAIALALACAAFSAPGLVPAVAIGLTAVALSHVLQMRRGGERMDTRRRERRAAEEVLSDLILRMPAVRTHGAALFERRRLGLRARTARGALARAEGRMAYARAPAVALAILVPSLLAATALWRGTSEPSQIERAMPGALVASGSAVALAVFMIALSIRLWFIREAAAPALGALVQGLETLDARRHASGRAPLAFPESGDLVADGAGVFDPGSGERLSGLDARLSMPGHVAIVGGRGSGVHALAALLAGHTEPTTGSVRYGGIDLRSLDPSERAHRIAFAGSEAILIAGSLKQNLLYGARIDDREAVDVEARIKLLKLAGLDAFVYARGLSGTIDPEDEPALAAAIVRARGAMRIALAEAGSSRLVAPFDPACYNQQASVGENILFGEAVSQSFSGENLAHHPYLRAVLEAEELTRPFVAIGLEVARSTVEIFSDLPDGHPLFEAFSLFPARERGYFEDLVARQPEGSGLRRGPAGQRDRERLIGLALRYNETRHRFGLIDESLEQRIVEARRSFATLMPPKFHGKVEFYDPARVLASASLEENVLFGRIAHGEAGAEARVRALIRQVLAEQRLEPTVYRLGLASRISSTGAQTGAGRRQAMGEGAIGPREGFAIELVRCLARRPDILVVGLMPDERKSEDVAARVDRLRAVRGGQGLIVCLPDAQSLALCRPFDAVLTVERNTVMRPEPNRAADGAGSIEAARQPA